MKYSFRTNKVTVKNILREQLKKISAEGYTGLLRRSQTGEVLKYEISTEYGTYQLNVRFEPDTMHKLVNVLGAIDGPGVFHFLGYVSSVTDFFSIDSAEKVEFAKH